MKIIHQHIVQPDVGNIRLQEYAVGLFYEIATKSSLKKAINKKRILVNGRVATTAHVVQVQDVIELIEDNISSHKVYNVHLKVLWEDDELAIIEKPSGISVSGNKFATIANALSAHITPSKQRDAVEPFPVHRLDYPTSGCLIIAKTSTLKRELHQLFEEQKIQKTYHAVTVGIMLENVGEIDVDVDGKNACTTYKVLQTIVSERFGALNLVILQPATGRKHQLRQHLLAIGNPIMGDQKYFMEDKKHKGYGLYLHASGLKFIHPITNEKFNIQSRLPKKILRLFPEFNDDEI